MLGEERALGSKPSLSPPHLSPTFYLSYGYHCFLVLIRYIYIFFVVLTVVIINTSVAIFS